VRAPSRHGQGLGLLTVGDVGTGSHYLRSLHRSSDRVHGARVWEGSRWRCVILVVAWEGIAPGLVEASESIGASILLPGRGRLARRGGGAGVVCWGHRGATPEALLWQAPWGGLSCGLRER
jgi:hypothetical protein